jgi:hypothetical protein
LPSAVVAAEVLRKLGYLGDRAAAADTITIFQVPVLPAKDLLAEEVKSLRQVVAVVAPEAQEQMAIPTCLATEEMVDRLVFQELQHTMQVEVAADIIMPIYRQQLED